MDISEILSPGWHAWWWVLGVASLGGFVTGVWIVCEILDASVRRWRRALAPAALALMGAAGILAAIFMSIQGDRGGRGYLLERGLYQNYGFTIPGGDAEALREDLEHNRAGGLAVELDRDGVEYDVQLIVEGTTLKILDSRGQEILER